MLESKLRYLYFRLVLRSGLLTTLSVLWFVAAPTTFSKVVWAIAAMLWGSAFISDLSERSRMLNHYKEEEIR